ncbi:MAG: DUF2752 domain-containing protein, partial [Tannerella sp.]|nr:DUF2752 domain-containing protein [Tannerella sp.]
MKKNNRIQTGIILIVVILTGIYIYAHFDPSGYAFFPKCPVYTITGYKCPGCGSQRAFYNLFQGNFATAFMYNPLMFLLVPYILFGIYIEYIANLSNKRRLRLRRIFYDKWAILILAIIIIAYT